MILDQLSNADRYLPLHPGFKAAFEYLKTHDVTKLEAGKHVIDGERLAIMVNKCPGRGQGGAKLEAHKKYIDIQLTIQGTEVIGWKNVEACKQVETPYTASADIAFYTDPSDFWLTVPPGTFAIFYPEDAHAPLAGSGDVIKGVMKIAVDWK